MDGISSRSPPVKTSESVAAAAPGLAKVGQPESLSPPAPAPGAVPAACDGHGGPGPMPPRAWPGGPPAPAGPDPGRAGHGPGRLGLLHYVTIGGSSQGLTEAAAECPQ